MGWTRSLAPASPVSGETDARRTSTNARATRVKMVRIARIVWTVTPVPVHLDLVGYTVRITRQTVPRGNICVRFMYIFILFYDLYGMVLKCIFNSLYVSLENICQMYRCECKFEGKYWPLLTTVTVLLMFWLQQLLQPRRGNKTNSNSLP